MSRTFVLVHGHWHGAWAWAAVAADLTDRGHDVIAVDLPSDRPGSGVSDNAAAVGAAMARAREDAVLVGHSGGGLTIPLVAAQRPVARLVFVAALLPEPGVSPDTQFEREPEIGVDGFTWVDRGDGLLAMPEDVARRHFYHDCAAADADRAVARLRLQSVTPYRQSSPLKSWPAVPASFIACRDDRTINPAWQIATAPARLGVDPIVLPSGHSPMLACPSLLADALETAAATDA